MRTASEVQGVLAPCPPTSAQTPAHAAAIGDLPGLALTDPWGRPYRYRRQDQGYLLYSLGADGRDSGGTDHGGPDPYPGTRRDDLCWYGREGQLATAG